ncbi:TetR family transcriptional regulator C-terminal domain-containing protein [Methylomarinum sp. Ch1-1]|uniref:TetR family transcriptional regulator C-terminal domain-containing protein n=1 Tax=Methylomarinum roseum TaxID=3067653 RepID=A0AAU7NQV5_9GAMM
MPPASSLAVCTYAAFGDKRGLFLASLDAYFANLKKSLFNVLHSDDDPLQRLRAFFEQLVQESCNDPDRKGCLLINTLSEIPVQDAEINARLQRMFTEVRRELQQVLSEAQRQGRLASKQNPEALAQFLVTGIFGLRLFNKMQPDRLDLQIIVDQLLSVIDPDSRHRPSPFQHP